MDKILEVGDGHRPLILPATGLRIDDAFVTPSLVERVRRCWCSHLERETKTSDHSVLLIEIEPPRTV